MPQRFQNFNIAGPPETTAEKQAVRNYGESYMPVTNIMGADPMLQYQMQQALMSQIPNNTFQMSSTMHPSMMYANQFQNALQGAGAAWQANRMFKKADEAARLRQAEERRLMLENNALFNQQQQYTNNALKDKARVEGAPYYGDLPTAMSPEYYRLNVAPTVDAVGERTLAARNDYLAGQRIRAEQAAARRAGEQRKAGIQALAERIKSPQAQPQQQAPMPPLQVQPLPQQQVQQPMVEPYAQDYGSNPYEQQPLQGNVAETTVPSANIPYGMDLVDAGYGAFTPKELLDLQQESRMQEQVPVADYTAGVGARKDLASAANTELDTQLDRRYGPGERSSMISSRNASAYRNIEEGRAAARGPKPDNISQVAPFISPEDAANLRAGMKGGGITFYRDTAGRNVPYANIVKYPDGRLFYQGKPVNAVLVKPGDDT
jgi:hypothetical protein